MKRIVLAVICLMLALGTAVLRPRFSPIPRPLPTSPGGSVLIAVEGLGVSEGSATFAGMKFSSYGLMPTRNGTPDDSDFNAGLRMILAGSRPPAPDAPTLIDFTRQQRAPFHLHTLTGANAVQDAANLVAKLTMPNGLPQNTSLFVVGITPSTAALGRRERVAPVYFWMRETAIPQPSLLTSPSTRRRPGLVAATDIASTVAASLDLPAEARRIGDGRPMETFPTLSHSRTPFATASDPLAGTLQRQATTWGLQAREQKLLPAVPWILAVLFVVSTWSRYAPLQTAARAAILSTPLALIAGAPFVTTAVPTLTSSGSFVYLLAAILILALATLAGRDKQWGDRLPRLLAFLTALVVTVDTCGGGYLLSRTPLSYSVLEAARFYGIGNEVSGLFLGAAIVAVGANQGVAVTLCWGLTAAVILGAPALGADAGGFIAALVGFTTLSLANRRGANSSTTRNKGSFVYAGIAVAVAIFAFALWDGSRPASSRTHIGEAVTRARETGFGSIATIARRKVLVNTRLLTTSPWAILLYVQVATIVWRYQRESRGGKAKLAPPAPVTHLALFATMLTLFALNDSGVVAGATCGCWLLSSQEYDGLDAASTK